MKSKNRKIRVTTELFFVYFLGYIGISLIILICLNATVKIYEIICSQRTYRTEYFENLEKKLENDYMNITENDLLEIKGFILKINMNNKIEYYKGQANDEFKELNLENYMKLFGVTANNKILVNTDIRSRSILHNFNNTIFEDKNNEKYSLYTKYLENEHAMIILGCPYSEITKPNFITKIIPNRYIIQNLTFCNVIIILLIVYILARKTSKDFIRPIKTLRKGVNEISNGNYNVRIDSAKINEFFELSQGFNKMAETIQIEKKEKARLEKIREELILDISHDLKNPLASILGYSETLINEQDIGEEEKLEYLNIINQNSYRANKLINDLFEFSLYENCEYELNIIKTDICEFLRVLVAGYINEFECRGFDYEFDILEATCYVMIDEQKLSRAINNILDNKVKYNSYGNRIFIKSEIRENYYYIILGDNGAKISEEYREWIFNPFARIDKSRNSKTGGTGLGLSITKKILNKHKGDIKIIDSEVGTNFEIMLPIVI